MFSALDCLPCAQATAEAAGTPVRCGATGSQTARNSGKNQTQTYWTDLAKRAKAIPAGTLAEGAHCCLTQTKGREKTSLAAFEAITEREMDPTSSSSGRQMSGEWLSFIGPVRTKSRNETKGAGHLLAIAAPRKPPNPTFFAV
jgi:hypothetical protein